MRLALVAMMARRGAAPRALLERVLGRCLWVRKEAAEAGQSEGDAGGRRASVVSCYMDVKERGDGGGVEAALALSLTPAPPNTKIQTVYGLARSTGDCGSSSPTLVFPMRCTCVPYTDQWLEPISLFDHFQLYSSSLPRSGGRR